MLLQTDHSTEQLSHCLSLPPTPGSRLGAAPASQAPVPAPALASPGAEGHRASVSQPAAGPGGQQGLAHGSDPQGSVTEGLRKTASLHNMGIK